MSSLTCCERLTCFFNTIPFIGPFHGLLHFVTISEKLESLTNRIRTALGHAGNSPSTEFTLFNSIPDMSAQLDQWHFSQLQRGERELLSDYLKLIRLGKISTLSNCTGIVLTGTPFYYLIDGALRILESKNPLLPIFATGLYIVSDLFFCYQRYRFFSQISDRFNNAREVEVELAPLMVEDV